MLNVRAPIAQSWKRSRMCGVEPGKTFDRLPLFGVDPGTPLLVAARPVLRRMADELGDAPLAVLLASRDGIVLDVMTPGGRGLLEDMARTRIGRQCTEETVGTNSIGTVLESGRRIRIWGEEHYLESLRSLNCLGVPIEHPLSGRVHGVLSLCGGAAALDLGLGTFLSYAAHDIRDRLLEESPQRHLDLLSAFQVASRGGRSVLVVDTDLVLASPSATAALEPADYTLLRGLGDDLCRDESPRTVRLELTSGKSVTVGVRRCGSARGQGLIIEFEPTKPGRKDIVPRGANARGPSREIHARELAAARRDRRRTLVSGEPGTGKTTTVGELAAGQVILNLDCRQATRPTAGWEAELADALAESARQHHSAAQPLVVLDGIETLPADTALRVTERVMQSPAAWVAMTSPPPEHIGGEHAALLACCEAHIPVRPVRTRTAELPTILRALTRSVAATTGTKPVRWTAEAIAALMAHPWPGNLHEMRAVVAQVASVAEDGCGSLDRLPCSLAHNSSRALSPLQRSEREVITETLRACKGNKVHVAAHLGISRTTLYKRMRELEISTT
jgi:transcriptional regulator of acetoin/glycerol metabolism